ncbi:F0F1 ATP synthase subunit epsilon [Echinicola shivajiensis]|uniref:F0F1 ATP synthase subunit epsilon n=1 Tax=Echinicola shivajiensis TaxID=1035916 RepID=UPI001BFCBCF2|nr:F0F1 ATP synthase subunit epsilon [Echinicola shivajiensis]
MKLKVLLPYKVVVNADKIGRVVLETWQGAFGILPNRLDCTAALAPGILMYEIIGEEAKYLAVGEGIMVKTGNELVISVRRCISGKKLGELHQAIEMEFSHHRESESQIRTALAKLESGFIRNFQELLKT